ncbi:MAG: hypothetical protein GXY61_04145 [Lentisphaerae bacterium]|jgi:hypothetical protein|nr:hypothetical protein [Lentisphaerota bacterium]
MKNNIGYIFVDDGYPEAEEYETNYLAFDMKEPGSYQRAEETANRMMAASRNPNTMVFRSIPLTASRKNRRPHSNRRQTSMGFDRIRNTLVRLIKE